MHDAIYMYIKYKTGCTYVFTIVILAVVTCVYIVCTMLISVDYLLHTGGYVIT
jgi:hypothetical protein